MTWRSISASLPLLCLLFFGCRNKRKELFSYREPGYYYRLLAFSSDSFAYRPGQMAWVHLSFKTQSDSVFWDSSNNKGDRLFFSIDSAARDNFIRHFVSTASVSDSACLLIRTRDFFRQQFGSDSIPFFSKSDSVVKVDLKLKQILDQEQFEQTGLNLQREEMNQIENFFGSARQMELAWDPLGFYWINKPPPSTLPSVEEGDQMTLSYKGYFLNGRPLEHSVANFECIYGTPDQLLKGLNYVSGRLKLGQTAKILLPSRLAFGENGSSNGSVPLFTPLIYELTIIDVKKTK